MSSQFDQQETIHLFFERGHDQIIKNEEGQPRSVCVFSP